jgi:bifunctional UDP-N-acetylglucosamine pyrophosphorylase/glucosamine-1-phosphate N-acetyltransferase
MESRFQAASIIMAAGRGSRMKNYEGNKTLLPLVPGRSCFEGTWPILPHIITMLPPGPRAVIVNYKSEEVMGAVQEFDLTCCRQPELNGTGGAIIAAREFIETQKENRILITMGDVPFVRPETYVKLGKHLDDFPLVILGFSPADKKQYGVLEIENGQVQKITEWKYWRDYPEKKKAELTICNAGIYAARREELLRYLTVLEMRPQIVYKERDGQMVPIQEYFFTDIVEYMTTDGLKVGYVVTEDENETMGVDDLEALEKAQRMFQTCVKDEGQCLSNI